MSALDDALNAMSQVSTTADGHVAVGASIGGQHVDVPTPIKVSASTADTVHTVQAVAQLLHGAVHNGHVDASAAVFALAFAISRGWIK